MQADAGAGVDAPGDALFHFAAHQGDTTFSSPRNLVTRQSAPATSGIKVHNRKDRYHDTQPPADATLRG
jgi:hypothetical protein